MDRGGVIGNPSPWPMGRMSWLGCWASARSRIGRAVAGGAPPDTTERTGSTPRSTEADNDSGRTGHGDESSGLHDVRGLC